MSQPAAFDAPSVATPPDSGTLADGLSPIDQGAGLNPSDIADSSHLLPDADPHLQAALSRQWQMAGAQDLRDRLGVALALDDPAILQADAAQLGSRVAQALSRLRAEAEGLALQSRELAQTLPTLTAERDGLLAQLAQTRAGQDRMRDALTSQRDAAQAERDRALAELTEARDRATRHRPNGTGRWPN
ncbi:hypothetical protein PANO111632_09140 [Paracoccus nototheniae]|uniref:Uncharacterized protein n=1 Tax=Paracoccus nototheniae TaxID=2489002 RepID=A0ABW4DST9_9RHOB|nr:hypothetical protein [Paracoccus nototheniae]